MGGELQEGVPLPSPGEVLGSRSIRMIRLKSFERLLKTIIGYLQCMLRDNHCYFSAMRLKNGGTVHLTPKSGGTRTPVTPPPKVTHMVFC